ncbi:MAG: AmmeMemoRadiSam system radical SAM enzyme [Chitinispirillaceae bacterium]
MKEALLWEKNEDNVVHCFLCSHHCRIQPNKSGFCSVRKNIDGRLFTFAYGKTIAEQIDPVEKKPLYHFLPDTPTFSIATIGCNFRCGFCQNWSISQTEKGEIEGGWGKPVSPGEIVRKAADAGCRSISFTYTEPTIFFEYAIETAKLAKKHNLRTVFVSNGYMTVQALQMIAPYLDACNIDLKSFRDEYYRKLCKARVAPVLDTLKKIHQLGIWLEVTTLVVTGENDSEQELGKIASFIADELSENVPWHVSRFFPQYEFTDHFATSVSVIKKAVEIGHKAGLHYVYAGNVGGDTDTFCPQCGEIVVHRTGYRTERPWIASGRCKTCGKEISGIWK